MNEQLQEQWIRSVDAKMIDLEKRLYAIELREAVGEEQYKVVINRLNKIDTHINRLVWIGIVAVLGGFMKFAMEGGLVVIPK